VSTGVGAGCDLGPGPVSTPNSVRAASAPNPFPLHAVTRSWRDLDVAVPLQGPYAAHWETISAGAVLVILPTLIVFLALQKFIYDGFTRGATR
jgi:ABC-type glycerol-3-phosphate transport system permease component